MKSFLKRCLAFLFAPFLFIFNSVIDLLQEENLKREIRLQEQRELLEAQRADRTIVRKAATKFWRDCNGCNTKFTYTKVSVANWGTIDARVRCPECGQRCIHDGWKVVIDGKLTHVF